MTNRSTKDLTGSHGDPVSTMMEALLPVHSALTIDWLIYQMAGHQIHHLKQLERIR